MQKLNSKLFQISEGLLDAKRRPLRALIITNSNGHFDSAAAVPCLREAVLDLVPAHSGDGVVAQIDEPQRLARLQDLHDVFDVLLADSVLGQAELLEAALALQRKQAGAKKVYVVA